MTLPLLRWQAWLAAALFLSPTAALASLPASKADLDRIINESADFLKNREPEMTDGEYAVYEKVVAMLKIQPEFAMQLLQGMTAGNEHPSPAFEFVMGNAQFNAGRRDEAEAHYRRAVEDFPDYQRAWTNLGVLYYGEERYEEAVTAFGKAVELGDSTAETSGMLAYALKRAGNSVGAEVAYLRALSTAPESADWIDGLCGLYIETRQYGRAEPLVRQLIKLQPAEPRHWQDLAGLLLSQDRPMEAIVVLESARGLQVANGEMVVQLGDLYAQQNLHAEALAVYRDLLRRDPTAGAKRLIGAAMAALEEGRETDAAEFLATADKDVPAGQRGVFLQTRAELAVARKDWTAARRDLEEALAAHPLDGPLLLRLGQVLKSGGAEIAAREYLEAAARNPESAFRAHLELADLELRAKHYQLCSDQLEQALAIEKSPALQEYLVKIKKLIPNNENDPKE
jgi:tetratricopeptide (TPR) repeat protein